MVFSGFIKREDWPEIVSLMLLTSIEILTDKLQLTTEPFERQPHKMVKHATADELFYCV